ncbi:MAG: Wzz/FepE/Etk N-terminal domain-containing protein [Pseudomonadales bacterium]
MNMAVEFEEDSKSLKDYIAIVRRRKKQLFVPAAITFVIMLLLAFLWPPTYQSIATILIEEQEIPKDLVRSTITSFANQQIQIITQRTMTLKNIMELVEKYELYDEAELKRLTKTEIATEFRDEDVTLDIVSAEVIDPRSGRPTEATIAFTLGYRHNNPAKAQKVANELVTLYLNENLRSRTEKTASTSEFLKSESLNLASQLEALETNLAIFKAENEGSLPELYQYNVTIIERTERELLDSRSRINELEKRKIQLEGELIQLSPYAPIVLPTGERVLSDYDRLKSLQSEYRRKSAVYNTDHPDVVRLVREIDVLKASLGGDINLQDQAELLRAEQDTLSVLSAQYTADHPKVIAQKRVVEQLSGFASGGVDNTTADVVADNPAYIFQNAQLESTKIEMKVLTEKIAELEKKIRHYEGLILKGPQVEKLYLSLQRDYANAQAKYQEIKAKLMDAELGQTLEQGRKGERFTLIQAPILPEKPVSPNRAAIVLVGLILSIGVGLGAVMIVEAIDQGIRGEKQLADVLGTTPMISVPYIYLEEELSQQNKTIYYMIGAAFTAGCLGLLLIHVFFKPLDVIWFILLRKFGLS